MLIILSLCFAKVCHVLIGTYFDGDFDFDSGSRCPALPFLKSWSAAINRPSIDIVSSASIYARGTAAICHSAFRNYGNEDNKSRPIDSEAPPIHHVRFGVNSDRQHGRIVFETKKYLGFRGINTLILGEDLSKGICINLPGFYLIYNDVSH